MPLPIENQNAAMRERLLNGALELFLEKGYHNTAIRDIIKKANVGTGTFYNYFADREDVLELLLEGFATQIMEGIHSYYLVEADLLERFVETKRITMHAFAGNKKLSQLYCRVGGTSPKIDACIQRFEDKLLAFYEKNIAYGISEGSFQAVPVKPVAHSILAIEKHLLSRWIINGDITKEEMIELVVSFHQTLAWGLMRPDQREGGEL